MKSLKRYREKIPVLACWPQYSPDHDCWHMFEIQLKPDGTLDWFLRGEGSNPISYTNVDEALEEAKLSNARLGDLVNTLSLKSEEKASLKLKVEKAIMAEERLMTEERWMLTEAVRRHAGDPRPRIEDLKVKEGALLGPLFNLLQKFPYIQYARIANYGMTLIRNGDFDWTKSGAHNRKSALYCEREKVARGFGLDGSHHWGKTKASIRSTLLPRANQLLHLTGFKQMLDDALSRGKRVVVCGGFVFWYEEKNSVGWIVKILGELGGRKDGNTLWVEGTILSKNHGRLVVLPYIKENGEFVKGHTKNAPHDGKALPRHPDHYVELPFEILKGDLMYDLFGRINYE